MSLNSSYEARNLKGFKLGSVTDAVIMANQVGQVKDSDSGVKFVVETAANVPLFPAPIVIEEDVYVDAREFTKLNRDGGITISNMLEYTLRTQYAQMEKVWIKNLQSRERMFNDLIYHVDVFSRWLVSAIDRNLQLDLTANTKLMALAGLYVIGQYIDAPENDRHALYLQELVGKRLGIPFNAFEMVTVGSDILFPRNIEEFVAMVKNADISPRLNDLTIEAIINVVVGTFWGVGQRNVLVATALEYPPAFLAMMFACLNNTQLNKSLLGTVIKQTHRGNRREQFLVAYQRILNA